MPEISQPSASSVTVFVHGKSVRVPTGSMVSAALLSQQAACRTSVTGEPRTALCGMGICFECRASINGVMHQRTCQLPAREGMCIETCP